MQTITVLIYIIYTEYIYIYKQEQEIINNYTY